MKALLGVFLFFLVLPAWADTYTEGLEVQCDKYQFRINDFDLSNAQPSKLQNVGTTIYYDHDLHKVSCVVNNHKIEAEFQLFEGSGKGECGGAYGGLITLKIDNQLIVKDAPNYSCTEGTAEIGVSPATKGGYELEICGHTDLRQKPAFRGCVRVTSIQLEKIQKPLNRFFPVGDLMRLVKF